MSAVRTLKIIMYMYIYVHALLQVGKVLCMSSINI